MAITHEQRMQVYENLPIEMKRLYSSQEAASLNRLIIEKFKLNTKQANDFMDISGDVILGFYRISDMSRMFQQKLGMSADESQRMTSQLLDFLEPIVRREEQEATLKKEELAHLANTFAQPENIGKSEVRPHETPEVANVEPIRTMEQDMSRIHGYGAYTQAREESEASDTTPEVQGEIPNAPRE